MLSPRQGHVNVKPFSQDRGWRSVVALVGVNSDSGVCKYDMYPSHTDMVEVWSSSLTSSGSRR